MLRYEKILIINFLLFFVIILFSLVFYYKMEIFIAFCSNESIRKFIFFREFYFERYWDCLSVCGGFLFILALIAVVVRRLKPCIKLILEFFLLIIILWCFWTPFVKNFPSSSNYHSMCQEVMRNIYEEILNYQSINHSFPQSLSELDVSLNCPSVIMHKKSGDYMYYPENITKNITSIVIEDKSHNHPDGFENKLYNNGEISNGNLQTKGN